MLENLVVIVLFLASLVYVGRLVYLNFSPKTVCGGGCAKCSALDVAKIKKQLEEKGM